MQTMDLSFVSVQYIQLILFGILMYQLYKCIYHYDYWFSKRVPGPKPWPFFGNLLPVLLGKVTFTQFLQSIYKEYKTAAYVGIYRMEVPVLIIREDKLIKDILVKNFDNFAERTVEYTENVDPLAANLFNIDAQRWRYFRTKFTPMFSSGKLKKIYYLILECADHLEEHLIDAVKENDILECQSLASRYTVNVIGSCIFGIDMRSMSKEEALFRKMGRKVFEPSFGVFLRRLALSSMPVPFKYLKLRRLDKDVSSFFLTIMKDVIEHRRQIRKSGSSALRHDFIDLVLQAEEEDTSFHWTYEQMAAHAFVFFVAGAETSASTISFALYELAQAPEIQEKLREEILNTTNACEGKLTYEALMSMKYLNMVLQEVLRKYPALPEILRQTTKPCMLGDTGIYLPTGVRIIIPAYAIHYDPKYYPNPSVFDPERFSDTAKQTRPNTVYLPFGDGPRNCIGKRFGQIQSKLGLVSILKNFRVSVCEKTDIPYKQRKTGLILASITGIHLKFDALE